VLGVAILVAAAALLGWRLVARYPHPPSGRFRILAPREVAFLEAASEALFPHGGELAVSGAEAGVPAWVDGYVALQPARGRVLMRLLFCLVEQATLVFAAPGRGGRRRFSSLDPAQRVAALEGWQRSRFFPRRLVFTSLRAILTMGYFAHPAVLRGLGLAPYRVEVPVAEADLLYPPIGQPPSAIRFTRADLTPPSDGTPLRGAALHPDHAGEPR
jgi:hypothetical protein